MPTSCFKLPHPIPYYREGKPGMLYRGPDIPAGDLVTVVPLTARTFILDGQKVEVVSIRHQMLDNYNPYFLVRDLPEGLRPKK